MEYEINSGWLERHERQRASASRSFPPYAKNYARRLFHPGRSSSGLFAAPKLARGRFCENDAKLGDDRDGRSGENFGGIRESKFFNRDYLSFFATIGKLIKISGSAANLREFLI